MNKLSVFLMSCAVSLLAVSSPADACTDFRVMAKDGTLIVGRSMEFAVDMNANLRSSNRMRQFADTAPDGKPAMSWKAKYGYLYIDGMNQDITVDGINENGLSFEYLYLPGETQYQAVPQGKESQSIPYYHFGDWVLGNFKTVDEVRQALANIFVYEQTLPSLGSAIFPLHAVIQDATGKGIVVEFVRGQMMIYDFMGVLTNSPTYDWQITNLRNYLNLSPYSPKPVTAGGFTFSSTGMGSGSVGLPGDASPPSRFTKISFMLNSVYPVQTAADALNLAQHLINNVDLPAGLVRSIDQGKESSDITQWVVFKDLSHKILYYRTYNDMTVKGVSMSKIDFSEKAPLLKMPLAQPAYIMDMTDKFMTAK
ncbi:Choloylglycine hydrolase [Aquicella siphonis]|uniref:Choloylglycine hydrolase n=1 Tax=Aquicella siphonis TaxID=254247 RepID=A0A5E4PEF8_9COXI|nr:linear amide C-N hydrolase [Aquicella siphonis]VVC74962.1 Choloylglycine hydrolase [Aquicella siphonis]